MAITPRLGVCYFPEHWPESEWRGQVQRMVDLGLSEVRIGEFSWAVSEPEPGHFQWDWLDNALDVIGDAGLKAMLCTPTATPPKWLIDAHPEILAWDSEGRPRRFGSRRHYCFSSPIYRTESARIVTALAERYGRHPVVTAWQTDNEYGCHDTVRSYSPAALSAFRAWLKQRYGDISALNAAWGNLFWSQTYRDFAEVDLPNLTVTEPNPSHVLDFYRFASDQVVAYNKIQVDILRDLSPGRPIAHNFMGQFTHFDHFKLAADLDIAAWDSYPLGFLDVGRFSPAEKAAYRHQGHPDFQAFHHDLYRACAGLEIMEQQPGPVNWARHNPAPLEGMVRLWTHEAQAHGAETVRYFRWRQAPFAQEQMHAGLERPDGQPAPASAAARQVSTETAALEIDITPCKAKVALVFDYEAAWLFEIQPQGADWSYLQLCWAWYGAARTLGLDLDIVPPGGPFEDYALILVPSQPFDLPGRVEALTASGAQVLIGPRSFSKTDSFQIPERLAPGQLQDALPLKVTYSESLPRSASIKGSWNNQAVSGGLWRDHVETDLRPEAIDEAGRGLLYQKGEVSYFTTVPDSTFLTSVVAARCRLAGIDYVTLPQGMRVRRTAMATYIFNYTTETLDIPDGLFTGDGRFLLGTRQLPAAGVAIWSEHLNG